jgi:signal transduction histidine kinase
MTRRQQIFEEKVRRVHCETDRMFFWLLLAQWVFAIGLACVISPFSYEGGERSIHFHVYAAAGFGAVINAVPLFLIRTRPGWWATRHTVAFAQMMWSAVLIMITGGRIETHFHVFGSLAFLGFYRDWRVLGTATVVIAVEHLVRGLAWPDSVYGVANPEWWRFLEHAAWVLFEDIVLVFGCSRSIREMRLAAGYEARGERMYELVEEQVRERTRQLQESMERYQGLVENTEAIPFEYEPETYRVAYIAPQAARLLDCDPEDLLDPRFFADKLHADDRDRVRARVRQYASGEAQSGEPLDYRMVAKSGRVVQVRAFLSGLVGDGKRVRGIMLDVTHQRLLESELRQAQKLESVGRLAAGVAHEINTPIQFISDSVQFAREAVRDLTVVTQKLRTSGDAEAVTTAVADTDIDYIVEEVPRALDRALAGTERVAQIVKSMKLFAHDRAEKTGADLNAAVESTLTIARAEYKNVADIALHLGELPQVRCYAGEINQVILNLVVNAAHAIADRVAGTDERGTITVTTAVDGDRVEVAVADTGCGIPDTIRDRIFDPFFTTKQVGRGTGQGLAIAHSVVVDKHGGTLTFDSEVGRGTTFRIRIPIAPTTSQVETAA